MGHHAHAVGASLDCGRILGSFQFKTILKRVTRHTSHFTRHTSHLLRVIFIIISFSSIIGLLCTPCIPAPFALGEQARDVA